MKSDWIECSNLKQFKSYGTTRRLKV